MLFLTALGGIDDRVAGLEVGGDDYLTKPFAFAELLARVNAPARRPPVQEVQTVLRVADLELDMMRRQARRGDQAIDLLPKEFTLLEVLMRNAGRVVTRTMLLERVWDIHFDPMTSVVETHSAVPLCGFVTDASICFPQSTDTPAKATVGAGFLMQGWQSPSLEANFRQFFFSIILTVLLRLMYG